MKGSVEFSVIFLMGCFMLAILIQFAGVISDIHRGHQYLDYVLHLTDNYDGNLTQVHEHVSSNFICKSCQYSHTKVDNRYEIEVTFPISISSLYYEEVVHIKGFSHAIE